MNARRTNIHTFALTALSRGARAGLVISITRHALSERHPLLSWVFGPRVTDW